MKPLGPQHYHAGSLCCNFCQPPVCVKAHLRCDHAAEPLYRCILVRSERARACVSDLLCVLLAPWQPARLLAPARAGGAAVLNTYAMTIMMFMQLMT